MTYYILGYHIEPWVDISGGLLLHNKDIVITDNTKIDKNCSIMGQVVIGVNFNADFKAKIILGRNIIIGTGAKIIATKRLKICDNVVIGANAVVTKSISKSGIYAGIPAIYKGKSSTYTLS